MISCASLLRAPLASNCEDFETSESLKDTIRVLDENVECSVDQVARELTLQEDREAVVFEGPTCVGSTFESVDFKNGLMFYAEYLARKLIQKHRTLGVDFRDCSLCSKILCAPDVDTHRYVSQREYLSLEDSKLSLNYCSD